MKNKSIVTVLGQRSPSARAVAYFRSSSQVDHEYAILSQQDQVRRWAEEHAIEIIHEFCDIGPSGRDAQEHPAFTEMIDDWIKPRSDFELVLCFDTSRLGRQRTHESSSDALAQIAKHSKQLICTSQSSQKTT